MELNLTSLKYKEKASLNTGEIDWRRYARKMNIASYTANIFYTSPPKIDRNCDVLPIEYDLLIVMFVNINITITIKKKCNQ
jgi:hypothetical protein